MTWEWWVDFAVVMAVSFIILCFRGDGLALAAGVMVAVAATKIKEADK
jgi:hypothetical protein